MEYTEEKLREINDKLDQVLSILKDLALRPAKTTHADDSMISVSGLSVKEDGSCSGIFRVCTDPKPWASGKGAFYACKLDSEENGPWYSVSITNNVAEKTAPGWRPSKGDVISVSGKYEEKNENGKIYKSVFAFRARPDGSLPLTRTTPKQNDEYGDVPF